jgi:hypothetical protein
VSALLVVWIVVFPVGGAYAAEGSATLQPSEPDPVRVATELVTDFPIDVAARVTVEVPARVRASLSLGVMPDPYADAINGFLVGVGAYDSSTADLLASALSSSFVMRLHAGIRPFEGYGFYVESGYRLVTLGGGAAGTELVAAVTGQAVPEGDRGQELEVDAQLHMVDVELGWELVVVEYLSLRFALGGAFTVDARTTVKPSFEPRFPLATTAFTEAAAIYLEETLEDYAFTPVASVGVGVVFE